MSKIVSDESLRCALSAQMNTGNQQGTLHFVDHPDKIKVWEYAFLVTSADYSWKPSVNGIRTGQIARMALMS
ncbi:hypothetical protein [Nitrosomonas sp. Nm34]|uniref:hypothetical protein n=1 Tax=Nitrosomonas sp. Nm34 TaxID=1881055 RepID=UPI0008E613EB|nr:hypothetical protein [Nitrosomonas sp. Nm34]SFI89617.1 hypothetical protein SAMN05428978_10545 [Nitrosomonas sp. Nm34]